MANQSSASMPAMEHSATATPPRSSKYNKYNIPRSRRISNNEIPLVHCPDCSRVLKVCTSKTDKNYDRQFYVCPTRTRDGPAACQFWEWEEGYEQYLVDMKLVPLDYQPVFESTTLPQQVPVVENKPNCGKTSHDEQVKQKPNCGETSHDEQVKQLREIVKLLKCLLVVCVLVLISNLVAVVRAE